MLSKIQDGGQDAVHDVITSPNSTTTHVIWQVLSWQRRSRCKVITDLSYSF